MNDERIYVIVPQTVQVTHKGLDVSEEFPPPEDSYHPEVFEDIVETFPMVHGRLIAQGVHIGRKLGHWAETNGIPYEDVTTIVLSVRNSKELRKVSNEIEKIANSLSYHIPYEEFHDTNFPFYGTNEKVHTITAIGRVTPEIREMLEDAIGYLELY